MLVEDVKALLQNTATPLVDIDTSFATPHLASAPAPVRAKPLSHLHVRIDEPLANGIFDGSFVEWHNKMIPRNLFGPLHP